MRRGFILLGVVLAVQCLAVRAGAQEENKPPKVLTRLIEIEDLLQPVDDHPLGGGISSLSRVYQGRDPRYGGGAAGRSIPETKTITRQERVDALMKLIQELVDPPTWRDAGGTFGAIKEIDGMLVITQTKANLDEIELLLKDLRGKARRTVAVEAYWVILNPGEIETIAPRAAKPGSPRVADMNSIQKLQTRPAVYHAEIVCFDRQLVGMRSGRAQTVVTDITPVTGQYSTGYEPTVMFAQDGAAMEVRPRVIGDDEVSVDIYSVVSGWNKAEPGPVVRVPASQPATAHVNVEAPAAPDRVDADVHDLATTAVLPMDKAVVIGGMTLRASPGAADQANAKELYLILRVTAARK